MTLRFETTPLARPPAWDVDRLVETRQVSLDPALREAFVVQARPAEDNLERLFSGGGLCVTTGQQPGLFLGPLFALYKALSAITLARRLTERLDRPVAPVFWVAGDDHDLAEANHVYVVNLANELRPLYQEHLGPEVGAAIQRLEETTPDTEFRSHVLQWVRRHYRSDRHYAAAFAGALADLLGPRGLLVLRPTHPGAKRTIASHLLRALERAGELDDALRRRVDEVDGQNAVETA